MLLALVAPSVEETPRWLVMRAWRKELGMSLQQVANTCGVSLSAVFLREKPKRQVPAEERAASYRRNREKRRKEQAAYRYENPSVRLRALYRGAIRRARRVGLECASVEAFQKALQPAPTNCACCGIALNYAPPKVRRGRDRGFPSLDRIDNRLGYTLDNVAVVCHACNTLKSNASIADLEMIIAYIRRNPGLLRGSSCAR